MSIRVDIWKFKKMLFKYNKILNISLFILVFIFISSTVHSINLLFRKLWVQIILYCRTVVLKLWYSCHLWHFDHKIVTLYLNFYVTLLTPRCKENDTQEDIGTDIDFCFQTIRVHWAINKLCGISNKVEKLSGKDKKTCPGNTTKFIYTRSNY